MSMPIAFVMKSFSWDFRGSRSEARDLRRVEPYVIAFCADADGQVHRSVTPIYFNSPRIGRQELTGSGHLFYGPKDPGGVLAFAIAVVESDEDIRGAGTRLEQILSGSDVTNAIKTASDLVLKVAGSTTSVVAIVDAVAKLLEGALKIIARAMKTNPDDVMWIDSGSFLADSAPPYQWGRRIEATSTLQIRGRSAFRIQYEVMRASTELREQIRLEGEQQLRALPTIFAR